MHYYYERISFIGKYQQCSARVRSFSYFRRLYPVVLIRSCFPAIHSRDFFSSPLLRPRLVFTGVPRWSTRMQLLLDCRVSFRTPRSFFRKLSFQMFITEITRERASYMHRARNLFIREMKHRWNRGTAVSRLIYVFYARVTLDPILLRNHFASYPIPSTILSNYL